MMLKILPLSLYQELHVVLLFASILSGKVDIDWHNKYVSLSEIGNTRAQTTRNFQCLNFGLKNATPIFGCEPVMLPIFYDFFKSEILFKEDCKNKLLDLYFLYFHYEYDENISCTWRIVCGCTKCKEVKKLNFS